MVEKLSLPTCHFSLHVMSVATTTQELSWENTGNKGTIADYPFARLKYYLNCVNSVLNDSDKAKIPKMFKTGYDKVCVLTTSESDELIRLARRWHPDIMVKRGLFRLDDKCQFCTTGNNKFTMMTMKEMKLDPANQIITQTTRTLKVMNFTSRWARKYFHSSCEQAEHALLSKQIDELTSTKIKPLDYFLPLLPK
jgi:hypothetical protein